jgi:hypothetical protein
MQTVDWVVLIIGAAMIAAGTFGWLYTVIGAKAKQGTQTRGLNVGEYVKALKDVPAPNLLIGVGALLVILAAGLVTVSVSGG